MKNQPYQATNLEKFKEEIARDIYGARSIIYELTDILEKSNHSILDDVDYRTEYIKLLKDLKEILTIHEGQKIAGSCTLVVRELNIPNYLKEWFGEHSEDKKQ